MTDRAAAVYLYGVIRDRDELVVDVPSINGEGPVRTIAHRGLAAVVSDNPLPRYELTRKNIRGHQAVVDSVMRTSDILPTRLGTVLASPESVVEDVLEKRWEELKRLLEHISGRVELNVKVSWTDLQQVLREIVNDHRGLRATRDRLARRPATATYEARLDLGGRTAQLLESRRDQEADELSGALEPLAVRVNRSNSISESMVLNSAFLVERERAAAFETAVSDLDHVGAARYAFVLAGPLPPYNFVGLDGP